MTEAVSRRLTDEVSMTIVFVSNYINHHQIPFCEEMLKLCAPDGSFFFIQTEEMEEERKRMGWGTDLPDYVLPAYENDDMNAKCRKLIFDSEVVIFGGCEDESYIKPRLEDIKRKAKTGTGEADNRLTFRYSERVYKEGQWKFITPRGLIKKNKDHTRYNDIPVYLLCSGGYVASDFAMFGAYKNKMFKWGYFPEVQTLDIELCLSSKGYAAKATNSKTDDGVNPAVGDSKVPYILWGGRMIGWKHPENAVKTAEYLKKKGCSFHMDIVGNGPLHGTVSGMIDELDLNGCVSLKEFVRPAEMREMMKKADIFLMTSDRMEGWGAVANESMNSGCCLIADCMEGAIPYLCRDGENAFVYSAKGGNITGLFEKTKKALTDAELRKNIARNAYRTVTEEWNAKTAAGRLMEMIRAFEEGKEFPKYESGPCSREYPMKERTVAANVLKGI